MSTLKRRGHDLGQAPIDNARLSQSPRSAWAAGYASLLSAECTDLLTPHSGDIEQSESLVAAILNGDQCDNLLDQAPYHARLEPLFENLGSSVNEGDEQEIETVIFDAVKNQISVAEDLWMKVSWLSFDDEDASLRFRFSFGVDLEEDVAADATRQDYAAQLADTVFPESAIIANNPTLLSKLQHILEAQTVRFVERIVYFNAPNGGAYLHHDLERGHAGVVYAQLTGQTFWLTLPQSALVNEIAAFVAQGDLPESLTLEMRTELKQLAQEPERLSVALNSFANSSVIHLINETQAFVQHLISAGYGTKLVAGDVMLLPQTDVETCCWHSVFCLGDEIGQALSFAIRVDD